MFSSVRRVFAYLTTGALVLILVFRTSPACSSNECTTAVISGSATVDGRPLLWKNRDTSFRDNEIAFLHGPVFRYLGVINSGDTTQVWAGVNEAGFAIMNAEALDVEGDNLDTGGYFMRKALGLCSSVKDFEGLLQRTNAQGRGTKSNFGVIDARGSAVLFEVGNHSYARYDANGNACGWIVRANFAQTGDGTGAGIFRFVRARELIGRLASADRLSPRTLLRTVARDLVSPWGDPYPLPFRGRFGEVPRGWISTANAVDRFRTASCHLFHGVKPGEDPRLTTYWCVLGEPVFGAAVPLWVCTGVVPNTLHSAEGAQLNRLIQSLEDRAYVDSAHRSWMDTSVLMKAQEGGLLPFLLQFEDKWMARVHSTLAAMREHGVDEESLRRLQRQAADELVRLVKKLGGTP